MSPLQVREDFFRVEENIDILDRDTSLFYRVSVGFDRFKSFRFSQSEYVTMGTSRKIYLHFWRRITVLVLRV